MPEIQGGRWDSLLRRLFSIKEQTIAPSLAPEIQPYAIVQEFTPEMYLLRGERLAIGRANQGGGGAATRSRIQLLNPAGSQSLVIIESIWVDLFTSTDDILLFQTNPVVVYATASNTEHSRDMRQPLSPGRLVGEIHQTATGAIPTGNIIATRRHVANVGELFEIPFVLSPGTELTATMSADNQPINVTFVWRERAAEGSELNV